jgi:DNA-binding MarR family transcriptional regulator
MNQKHNMISIWRCWPCQRGISAGFTAWIKRLTHQRITAYTLSAYFSRSGALAYKRSTGLSNFEAWVLNEISMNPPISWAELAAALQRDHSQAGRTVRALIDRGLVVREGKPGRRHGKFYPTPEGELRGAEHFPDGPARRRTAQEVPRHIRQAAYVRQPYMR